MTHKERCSVLKKVRKTIADNLGIDLHQTECTYEGECSGTCPKCAKEEKILNKALISGTAIASSVALCACNVVAEPVDNKSDKDKDKGSKRSESKGKSGKTKNSKELTDRLESLFSLKDDVDDVLEGEALPIDGDVSYVPDPNDYEGGLGYYGEDDEIDELAGDVVMEAWTYDELCTMAANYTGAPICEVDSEDEYGNIVIHCYEIVDNGEDDIHTATVDWLTVNPWTSEATNMMGETVYLNEYY